MRYFNYILFVLISQCLWLHSFSQPGKPLNISYMLRGYFYAGTAVEDTTAAGGFASSDNLPKQWVGTTALPNKIQLIIDPAVSRTFAKGVKGYAVYLVNSTGRVMQLPAADSRLSITAEAYIQGKWQAIEYLPQSWCGNSYHHVFIKPGQYWEFTAPVYGGKLKTRLRYKLVGAGKGVIYSNEIESRINSKQLTIKQGHTPQGIMDPYED